jgi:hypothetical protein
MPITISVTVKEERPRWLGSQREFNEIVRHALRSAAFYWFDRFLPLHFQPGSARKYGYTPRTQKYQRLKYFLGRAGAYITKRGPGDIPEGTKVRATFPPQSLVWTGDMKQKVLSRPPADYVSSSRATATSNRQRIRIPIPLGHPIPAHNTHELTVVTPDEYEILSGVFRRVLLQRMGEDPRELVTLKIA